MSSNEAWTPAHSIHALHPSSAAWGTAHATQLGAGDQFGFISENMSRDKTIRPNNELTGSHHRRGNSKGGRIDNSGPIVYPVDLERAHMLIALADGIAGVPSTVEAAVAFLHTLRKAKSNLGKYATMVLADDDIAVREYVSAKATGYQLTCNENEDAQLQVTWHCHQEVTDDSGVNDLASFSGITPPANTFRLGFEDGIRVDMKAQAASGDFHATNDEIFIQGVQVTVDGKYKTDHFDSENSPYRNEPKNQGFGRMEVQLTLSTFESMARVQAMLALAPQRLRLQWLSSQDIPGTGASNKYEAKLWLPNVELMPASAGQISGGESLPGETITLVAEHEASAVPDGFPTGSTTPWTWQFQNSQSADPLSTS